MIYDNIAKSSHVSRTGESSGGGLFDCLGDVHNNTIYGNTSDKGGGLANCLNDIANCIIYGNDAFEFSQIDEVTSKVTYSCIQDWAGSGLGNISDAPRFADPANNNFRLLPGSPCIDTGAFVEGLVTDILGNPHPLDGDGLGAGTTGDGSDYDIGAYEFK